MLFPALRAPTRLTLRAAEGKVVKNTLTRLALQRCEGRSGEEVVYIPEGEGRAGVQVPGTSIRDLSAAPLLSTTHGRAEPGSPSRTAHAALGKRASRGELFGRASRGAGLGDGTAAGPRAATWGRQFRRQPARRTPRARPALPPAATPSRRLSSAPSRSPGRAVPSRRVEADGAAQLVGALRRRADPRRARGHSTRRHRASHSRSRREPHRSPAMAKEGAQRAEETEQMIEKEGGKEAAESSAGGSLRAADTKEMRAVVLSAFGGLNKLRVSKKAMPEPQEGELKIRVKAWSSIASLPGRGRAGLSAGWGRGRRVPGGGTSPLVASAGRRLCPASSGERRCGCAVRSGAETKIIDFRGAVRETRGKTASARVQGLVLLCAFGPCGARSAGPAAGCRHGAVPARLAVCRLS